MKVLLTGANGFAAHYLANQLLEKNYQVVATGKGPYRLNHVHRNFSFHSLDFTDEAAVKKIFSIERPDIVVHAGAVSKPDDCEKNREDAFRINVSGTVHLLNHASLYKSYFVFLSTDFIFDGESGPYKEDDAPNPVNYYGQTKLLAEKEVMKYGYDHAIIRTVLVYGKTLSGRHNIVTAVAAGLERDEQQKIFNDQVRTPTYVEDLAAGIVLCIEKRATGVFHISGEEVWTPYRMAIAVADHLNKDRSLIESVTAKDFQPFPGAARRPLKTGFDISKAKKELGFKPVSFMEGLRKTLTGRAV